MLCLALVDVTIRPQELDLQLLDWLRHRGRNFLVVATKADRISSNQLRASCRNWQNSSRSLRIR